MMLARFVVTAVLFVAVFGSAIAAVYTKHRSRELFVEHQQLVRERDELNIEWGRLRLEQGAWATHSRVERVAREKLGLHIPERDDIVFVHTGGRLGSGETP